MEFKYSTIIAAFLASLGSGYFGIFLSRKIEFQDLSPKFIGPTELFDKKHYESYLGKSKAQSFHNYISIISSVLIFLLVTIFLIHTNLHEKYQLAHYPVNSTAVIKEIHYREDKRGPVACFDYSFDNKKYYKELYIKTFQLSDTIDIVFSSQNPNILILKGEL